MQGKTPHAVVKHAKKAVSSRSQAAALQSYGLGFPGFLCQPTGFFVVAVGQWVDQCGGCWSPMETGYTADSGPDAGGPQEGRTESPQIGYGGLTHNKRRVTGIPAVGSVDRRVGWAKRRAAGIPGAVAGTRYSTGY